MNAQDILDRIAPDQAAHAKSLTQPVAFSDGTTGSYVGYVERRRPSSVDFVWSGKTMTINNQGVICSRSKTSEGKTWYGYTLDPFGEMRYSDERDAAQMILAQYRKQPAAAAA